jgi:hypothetical protein
MRHILSLLMVGGMACSGGSGSTGDGASAPLDGAVAAADGAGTASTDTAGGLGTDAHPRADSPATATDGAGCTSATEPTTILSPFGGYSISVVGQDVYYVEPGDNAGRGAIHRISIDGTAGSAIVNASPGTTILGATALDADLFYFQEDDPIDSAIHLYRASRAAGGAGQQVGTGTYPGFGINIIGGGYAGIIAAQTAGVFAQHGTDIFVSDQGEIARVSLSTGEKTVLTPADIPGGIKWPSLVGNTIFYKDGLGAIYSVPADATTASGARLGGLTCGSGNTQWMSSHAGGFLCGEAFGIDAIDAAGTMKTHVIYTLTDKDPQQFNPSSVDGPTYYALPKSSAKDAPLYKMDLATGTKTAVACSTRTIIDAHLTSTDLVFVELRGDAGNAALSLKRLAR